MLFYLMDIRSISQIEGKFNTQFRTIRALPPSFSTLTPRRPPMTHRQPIAFLALKVGDSFFTQERGTLQWTKTHLSYLQR